jgi:phosphoglycerate dehydrogenase-like enzyme
VSPPTGRRIVLTQASFVGHAADLLRTSAPQFDVIAVTEASDELIATAEVFAGHLEPQQISQAVALRWNHLWSAGADADLSPQMRAATQVALTTSAGNGAVALAEHALMLMLMLDRDAPRWLAAQRAHVWDRFSHSELAGQTVGIIGMGAAGRDLAAKCAAFHMQVLGLRQRPAVAAPAVTRMYGPDEIIAFAGHCDYLVIAAPLTDATKGMVSAEVIAAMKPSAAIVNVSRGAIVDEAALAAALASGRITRAGLDAHAQEPLTDDSPWWDQPGVIVTPHNAATTVATERRSLDIFLENVDRYVHGLPLRNLVDRSSGYAAE